METLPDRNGAVSVCLSWHNFHRGEGFVFRRGAPSIENFFEVLPEAALPVFFDSEPDSERSIFRHRAFSSIKDSFKFLFQGRIQLGFYFLLMAIFHK